MDKIHLFIVVLSFINIRATTIRPIDEIESPYEGCTTYNLGGKYGFPLTHDAPLRDQSALAFYPLTNKNTMLYLHLIFPDVLFKVKIEGTMVTLLRCNRFGRNCKVEGSSGVKSQDYIRPHMWNKVQVAIRDNQLFLYIGTRMIKKMSSVYIEDTDRAFWSVLSKEEPVKEYEPEEPDYIYLVQYDCDLYVPPRINNQESTTLFQNSEYTTNFKEFTPETTTDHISFETTVVTREPRIQKTTEFDDTSDYKDPFAPTVYTSSPHVGDSKTESAPQNSDQYVGLIVGVVVAVILLLAVVIILYNVIRKKYSANITEKSPLQNEQQLKQQSSA